MDFKDYYQTLGLARDATADDIKKAYRKLARKYHPDVSREPQAAARMAEVNEANAVLSDPQRRAAYDALGRSVPPGAGPGFQPPPHWDAGFEFTRSPEDLDSAQFSEFFEALFGRSAHGRRAAASAGTAHGQRGSDHHARIELDLRDAYHGAERTLSLRGTRLDAQGRMVQEERQLQVAIPRGVRAGQLIRLAGQGSPGSAGAPAGDLFLEVEFAPDARWRAEDRDVYQRVALAPWEAELGGTIQVATPGGDLVEVAVPAGWKPGRKLRLRGRGIPAATPGDLYLELQVALPPAGTEAQRQAYRAFAQAFSSFNPRSTQGG